MMRHLIKWSLLSLLLGASTGAGCSRAGFFGSPTDQGADLRPADVEPLNRDGGLPDAAIDGPTTVDVWQSLAGSASGAGLTERDTNATTPRLAMGPNGTLFHAWSDNHTGTWQVYLRRWNGTVWTNLEGSAEAGGVSDTPDKSRLGSLAVDTEGEPWLCWFDHGTTQRHIYLRRHTTTGWAEVAGSASDGGISGHVNVWWPAMALLDGNQPVVAWERYNALPNEGAIHLRRLEGTAWAEVEGSATGAGVSSSTESAQHVVVRSHGSVTHLLWRITAPQDDLRYRRLTDAFSPAEAVGAAAALRRSGTLTVSPYGAPYAAWQETTAQGPKIRAARRESSGWKDLGIVSGALDAADHPSIAITAQGTVYVVFQAKDALGTNIHIRRLDGGLWVEPDGPLPHGISNSAGASTFPQTLQAGGRLYVLWEQKTSDATNATYLRYREGT